jgi:hypothetical protein
LVLAHSERPGEEQPARFLRDLFWSDQCRDGDASVDVASGDVLRIKMKAIAEARGEPKLTERPILVLPVSKYFASVYKICQAMVDSSSKPGDA